MLVQNNIPAYETPEEAVKTYVNMFRYKRNLGLLYETPSECRSIKPCKKGRSRSSSKKLLLRGCHILRLF